MIDVPNHGGYDGRKDYMMTEIRRTENGYGVYINGTLVKEGFIDEQMAKRAVPQLERKYALESDPDYIDFRAYNTSVEQVEFFCRLRAEIGETAAPEDVITAEDHASSVAEANERISFFKAEAAKHYSGARRWANACRIQLKEVGRYV